MKKLLFAILLFSLLSMSVESWGLDQSHLQYKLFAGQTDDQPGPY